MPCTHCRKCANCRPCAIVSGWSGAGAFSDGKLTMSPEVGGRILDYMDEDKANELIKYADDIYLSFGAASDLHGVNTARVEEIRYEALKHNIRLIPCAVRHLGTEKAFNVLKAMYDYLVENNGIEFSPLTTAKDIIVKDGKVTGVIVEAGTNGNHRMQYVVAAPGRDGAGWLAGRPGSMA